MSNLVVSDYATVVVLDDWQQDLHVLYEKLATKSDVQYFLDIASFMDFMGRNERTDLIIIDINTLNCDGDNIIARLRNNPHLKNIPIVLALTANDSEQETVALGLSDVDDYFTKPYSAAIVAARVEKIVFNNRITRISRDQNHFFEQRARDKSAILTKVMSDLSSINHDLLLRQKETLLLLSRAADYRDPETGSHLKRMANYSRLIARNLGFPEIQQELIFEAAPLHDIGKIGISDEILLKPGRLTPEEFETMKQHANISYEILKGSTAPLMIAAAEIALTHHEKFDGSGYPNGLKGEEIPMFGRIVAVADVFDALTSSRPYKSAWPISEAIDFLESNKGTHFDPICVDAFLDSLDEVLDIYHRFRS